MTSKHRRPRAYKALFIISYLLHVSIGCNCNRNPEGDTTPRTKHKKGKITTSSNASSSSSVTTSTSTSSSSSQSSASTLPRSATISQGLPSIGNSCYMNASLQAFTAFYSDLKNPDPSSSFTTAAKDLITTLTDPTAADRETLIKKAQNFFNSFGSVGLNFPKGTQQDASEVLIKLLDNLDAPQAETKIYLTNKATGEMRLSESVKWSIYNLPLKASDGDKQSLQDIFERSLQDERQMKWNDTDVAQQEVIEDYKLDANHLKKLSILPIHLGRFANDKGSTSKVNTSIINPFELVIKQEHFEIATSDLTYELCGFIEHRGSTLTGGHYVTYAKEGGKWILYNDENVSEPSQASVEKAASDAYTLFYKPKP